MALLTSAVCPALGWAEPLALVTNWCCASGSVSAIAGTSVQGPPIETGHHPTDIVMGRDGAAYIAHGDFAGGAGNGVSVISLPAMAVYREITVSPLTANGLALSPDQRHLYVTHATSSKTVTVIDTATFTPVASIALEHHGHRIAISPDGARAVVTSLGENSVAFIDLQFHTLIETVPINLMAESVAIAPDGRRVYVTNGTWKSLTVLDMATRSIAETIGLPATPHTIVISPTGGRAYLTNPDVDSVAVLDLATGFVSTVSVGDQPRGIALTSDGTRAYVVNFFSNSVSVLDTTSNAVVATVEHVGSQPTSIAIMSGPAPPALPVLFIPGILGDSSTWKDLGRVLEHAGWQLGGCPAFDQTLGTMVSVPTCTDGSGPGTSGPLRPGDFYRMQFSDNQQLTFLEQGQELDSVISAILAATNAPKVVLVAHSMGGLAARSYLQRTRHHDHRVSELITIGTPHLGAEVAHACRNAPTLECSAIGFFLGLDWFSVAVRELDPSYLDSQLWVLNELDGAPLPADVAYTSLRGVGTLLLADPALGDGDGVVTETSQDLQQVPGAPGLAQRMLALMGVPRLTSRSLQIRDGPCDKLFSLLNPTEVRQTHTCETQDLLVVREVLHRVERPVIALAAPNGGETWTIGSVQVIGWTFSGGPGEVRIELSRDGGTSWESVIATTADDGSHAWTVEGPTTTRARVRISRRTDPTVVAVSDGEFTIGPAPPQVLVGAGPATLWLGGATSQDAALKVDLKVILKHGGQGVAVARVALGKAKRRAPGSPTFDGARLVSVPMDLLAAPRVEPGDNLIVVLKARVSCSGSGGAAGTLRLWHDGAAVDAGAGRAPGARVQLAWGDVMPTYFFRGGGRLMLEAGSSVASIDAPVSGPCGAFVQIAKWRGTVR